MSEHVVVGLGVIMVNKEGKVLIGKRKGFVPKYSIPGGHLDTGETFEQGAIREIKEETDLDMVNPKVIGVTNNLETFKETGKHYISVVLLATEYSGEIKLQEPEKCEEWIWCDPRELPQPHFDASSMGVDLYLKNKFYIAAYEN
jgi:ADP-ribose pyrophosphatase YjhB (NUDIX family)